MLCIVMYYDDKIKSYGDLAYKINSLYAKEHGYDIRLYTDPKYIPSGYHAAWAKVLVLLEVIKESIEKRKYSWICWIDADAVFLPRLNLRPENMGRPFAFSRPLTYFLNKIPKERILGVCNANAAYNGDFNSGVMLFRVCADSVSYLQRALQFSVGHVCSHTAYWEQEALLQTRNVDEIAYFGTSDFNSISGETVMHIVAMPTAYRFRVLSLIWSYMTELRRPGREEVAGLSRAMNNGGGIGVVLRRYLQI